MSGACVADRAQVKSTCEGALFDACPSQETRRDRSKMGEARRKAFSRASAGWRHAAFVERFRIESRRRPAGLHFASEHARGSTRAPLSAELFEAGRGLHLWR